MATYKEKLGRLILLLSDPKPGTYDEFMSIKKELEGALAAFENIDGKTKLFYKDRKAIAKEFDEWRIENNAESCCENMATWFLSIKLREWIKNDK